MPITGLSLALDANFPKAYYNDVRFGAEYLWHGMVALRAGYRHEMSDGGDDPLTGPTFGMGAGWNGYWLDYGYLISSNGEAQHRLGFRLTPGGLGVLGGALGHTESVAPMPKPKKAPALKPTPKPEAKQAAKPVETKPVEKVAESKPVETKPTPATTPAKAAPMETKPADKPVDKPTPSTTPAKAAPVETKPADKPAPVEAKSTTPAPSSATPAPAKPVATPPSETSEPKPAPAPPVAQAPKPAPSNDVPPAKAEPRPSKIKVKSGDTLASIGRQWNVSPAAIMMENNLVSESIKSGQTLKLPPAGR
jgi:LysM repeat protein